MENISKTIHKTFVMIIYDDAIEDLGIHSGGSYSVQFYAIISKCGHLKAQHLWCITVENHGLKTEDPK